MKLTWSIVLYILLIFIVFGGFLFSTFTDYDVSLYIFGVFVASGGFVLSLYIRHMKRSDKSQVCLPGSDCKRVITSEYSQFFGIPLEIMGMLYYGIVFFTYAALILYPNFVYEEIVFGAMALTSIAFLFSIYLVFIQAFALKQWCMWCLLSAVFSSIIFIVSFGKLSIGTSFLLEIQPGLQSVHLLAFSLGIGGATIVSILFFRFLKDFRISELENSILRTVSEVIWFSLALLVLSEFALYLPQSEILNSSPQFLAKMIAILVLVITGVMLSIIITPRLIFISFKEKGDHKEVQRFRNAVFYLGAVTMTSWYFAFILEGVGGASLGFLHLIIMYITLLAISIIISQAVERKIST